MSTATLKFTDPVELTIPVPWGKVSAKAWGNPDKQKVLGLHGWMDNAGTFDRLVPHLKDSIYFVAVDLPGHGLSSHYPPGMSYHFSEYMAVVRRITNYLKWPKFSIIGHSMGAAIAAYFASMYPKIVDKVVMLDMIKALSYDEGATGQTMAKAVDQFLTLDEKQHNGKGQDSQPCYPYKDAMRRWIMATDDAITEESAECLMARGSIRVSEDKWTFRRDIRLRAPSFYRMDHQQSLKILKGIESHLLLIKAKDSSNYGMDSVVGQTLDLYKEKCKSFKYVEVEGNHFVHLNEPGKIARLINEFFDDSSINKASL